MNKEKIKGRLKIFLGMAAGVGKTYAMLEEAQGLKNKGIDLVIGVVDTHGRKETATLLHGQKIIPQKTIVYKGVQFQELDLDSIIKLNPSLVLIDELAHTNIPGVRHEKRWQDVIELLENGIDVYTTLNVQHIESLKETIEKITNIHVKETVPDLIIATATSIRLVDLPPDELIDRLREGKVYFGDQSKMAMEHFFQKDRLTALREIVLRYAAEKVDIDLHTLGVFEWTPREKLLVAINHTIDTQRLLRVGCRLAFNLDAPWIVVYVNTGLTLDEEKNSQLEKNLTLARNLGAEVMMVYDTDIAVAIERITHSRGVTQIIIGRTSKEPILGLFRRFTLLNKIAKECGDIDVHVIRQKRAPRSRLKKILPLSFKREVTSYLLTLICLTLFSLINWVALPLLGSQVSAYLFLPEILLLCLYLKKGAIFFASLLYAFIWYYFFPPFDLLLFTLYCITAVGVAMVTDRARENKKMLIKRVAAAQALYDIVRLIATAPSKEEIYTLIKEKLSTFLEGLCEIMIKELDGSLSLKKTSPLLSNEKEKNAAIWVFENGKEAGLSTDTLPSLQQLYIPLKGFHEVFGVFIYKPKVHVTIEEKNFLYTICQQLASYLERSFSERRGKQKEQEKRTEKIHKTILHRISSEVIKPLLVIKQGVQKLKTIMKIETTEIDKSVDDLLKITSSMSIMLRLSEDTVTVNKKLHPIREVIDSAVKKVAKTHKIVLTLQPDLPLLLIDFSLLETLLYNLLSNAIDYSPHGSSIEIEGKKTNGFVIVSVADEGRGIPEDQLETIFEKFYRLPEAISPGVGLGLPIAKAIAEIHHATLKVENRPIRGAKFSLIIPIKQE